MWLRKGIISRHNTDHTISVLTIIIIIINEFIVRLLHEEQVHYRVIKIYGLKTNRSKMLR